MTAEETRGRPPDGTVGFLHMDMDAFYAAVEIRRRPELRDRPVVVGGVGGRGVVAAASYEARYYGVHSAMPSTRARRLCPHAVFLPGDPAHYAEVSERVMAILTEFTPLVEPLSLDEAFLDVRGARRVLGNAPELATRIRSAVLERERLTCSVGAASTKFVAKLATERAKPRAGSSGPVYGTGVHVVDAGAEIAFLHPHPVTAVFGVGPATAGRLARLGVETVGDLASLPETAVVDALGKAAGRQLHLLSNGVDDRPVVVDRAPKSLGQEETFARDLHTPSELDAQALRLGRSVARRLRGSDVQARTITVKLRFADFKTITRSVTLPEPCDGSGAIVRAARGLLAEIDPAPGVRLLGVSGSGLVGAAGRQLSFDDDHGRETADRVMDEIRERFGQSAIGPAGDVRPGRGLVSGSDGRRPWGPDGADSGPG